MPVIWSNTSKSAVDGINIMGYGRPGVGKTEFIRGMPSPLIISSERGNMTLRNMNIPVAYVESGLDLKEAYEWVKKDGGKNIKSVAMDSVSDIANTMLKLAKLVNTNGQKAYGDVADVTLDYMRKFRDLPFIHKYFIAQQEFVKNEATGALQAQPAFPGKQIGQNAPYFFDLLLRFEAWENPETKENVYYVQTKADQNADAKDRSGVLDKYELNPDFNTIMTKIYGGQQS